MKKIRFLIGITSILVSFTACNKGGSTTSTTTADSSANTSTANPDAQAPDQVILEFAKWYRANETALNQIEVIHQREGELYHVIPAGLDAYIAKLKGSGFFSDTYLDSEKEEILKLDADFVAEQQMDGPPSGWDYDRVLLTQDTEAVLDEISKPENLSVKGSGNSVVVIAGKSFALQFSLSHDAVAWKIDRIEMTGE